MVTTDRGDVAELLDAYGQPFAAYRYDAWGNPQASGGSGTGIWWQQTTHDQQTVIDASVAEKIAKRQVLRYASYCYDSESQLYYLSARSYDPKTRQFLSKDLSRNDGEQSAYQYCGGNPVRNVDPTGLRPDDMSIQDYNKLLRKRRDGGKYSGQVASSGVGSHNGNWEGGIYDLGAYLPDRYPEGDWFLYPESNLQHDLANFTMDELDPDRPCCVLTAITRVLDYLARRGDTAIPKGDISAIFNAGVRANGGSDYVPNLGETAALRGALGQYSRGSDAVTIKPWPLGPTLTTFNDIAEVTRRYGPSLLNIPGGYYRNHTVTVGGYRVYTDLRTGNRREFISIQDGWDHRQMFIDVKAAGASLSWSSQTYTTNIGTPVFQVCQ